MKRTLISLDIAGGSVALAHSDSKAIVDVDSPASGSFPGRIWSHIPTYNSRPIAVLCGRSKKSETASARASGADACL
jgi:hypothetical protein